MEIKYIFLNSTDLLETDSSLSMGWFVIDGNTLFENTKCMVAIALTDLAEGMQYLTRHKSGGFSWIPADSGETVLFRRSGNKISFQYKAKKIETEFDLFYRSVYDSVNTLAAELLHFRDEVATESAYVDLTNILKN